MVKKPLRVLVFRHAGPYNKPKSRGAVTLVSADPKAPPKIQFNYLQHPDDIEGFRACVRLTREIINQAPFDEYRGEKFNPAHKCKPMSKSMPLCANRLRVLIILLVHARWAQMRWR